MYILSQKIIIVKKNHIELRNFILVGKSVVVYRPLVGTKCKSNHFSTWVQVIICLVHEIWNKTNSGERFARKIRCTVLVFRLFSNIALFHSSEKLQLQITSHMLLKTSEQFYEYCSGICTYMYMSNAVMHLRYAIGELYLQSYILSKTIDGDRRRGMDH